MRYLGIDWGSRYVGVAISDEKGVFAFPYEVIDYKKIQFLVARLKEIIKKENIKELVIGLPKALNQQDTAQTREVRSAMEILKNEFGLPINFSDEIMTSKMAEQYSEKNVHASSAALILQGYLDFLSRQK